MKLLLQLFAMILLVLPTQHLIRGIIGGIQGKGYSFAILGLSNIVVIIGSIGSWIDVNKVDTKRADTYR
ncbi:hypothetical protein P7D92_10820 [Enterococcus dongliensis]|uniref:hypothetical protein n=1 Tax=Enterococcus dongliensis TaxID=2559925 RepID=UPI00288D66AB|nr:hypothetical protein [Enterococcus dongliensis]MDT2677445.1 hypothetical protein [Enterococcus dongliensis]